MDGARFDAMVRGFHSRRATLRVVVGLGAALAAPRAAAADESTCDPVGARCDPATPGTCCTKTCKKHRHKHAFKCAKAGGAFGCKKRLDFCRSGEITSCPDYQGFSACVGVGRKRKPLCIVQGPCQRCKRDADCVDDWGPTARCIEHCRACKKGGAAFSTVCAVPAVAPD